MTPWKAYVESLIRTGHAGHRLYIMRSEGHEGRFSLVTNMTFQTFDPFEAIPVDKATLDDSHMRGPGVAEFLQAMSDVAWEIGIKPKQLESHTDELKAVRYHLEDMRTMAMKK